MTTLKNYLREVEGFWYGGIATEHTYRPALKTLLEDLVPGFKATNEPKRVECGAPDFVITRSPANLIIGYLEAKDIGVNLDEVEKSEQLKRYRRSLPNLILTNQLEFSWFVDGKERRTECLGKLSSGNKISRSREGEAAVLQLLRDFLSQAPQPIGTSKDLAARLARLAQMIRDIVVETFRQGKASTLLTDLRRACAAALIPDLDKPDKTGEFADMFAQTLAYGLFAARAHHPGPEPFTRLKAAAEIPKTNPFLRKLFEIITGPDLDDEPYVDMVNDLVQVLAHADMEAVLAEFGRRKPREDPVVHLYETFLKNYDPKLREMRGVYYTPEAVVSYIVRSVDWLLRTRFNLPGGLGDEATITYEKAGKEPDSPKEKPTAPKVLILDPACGTGTFLYTVVDLIRNRFRQRGDAGMWSGYVRQSLLPRLFGFELLMAPYAVAHLKLGLQLAGRDLSEAERRNWAYDFARDERLGVYLTNTLEETIAQISPLYGAFRAFTEEAQGAAKIKQDLPILVVMGNPPYSGVSANMGKWIVRLLKGTLPSGEKVASYYEVDGKPLAEKKVWLQNDYVKFMRWGQWRIERTGAGILAFITDNGYLDNPTFRGMRQKLMQSFSEIYILDLHGSTKKKERCPDGSKDENIFDIQQGVAITIFVKEPYNSGPAKVYQADLWGLREIYSKANNELRLIGGKYHWLMENDISTTYWNIIKPQTPSYLLSLQNGVLEKEYLLFPKITDILPLGANGIQTSRDNLVIAFRRDELQKRFEVLLNKKISDDIIKNDFNITDYHFWNIRDARIALLKDTDWTSKLITYQYRPFDQRCIFLSSDFIHRLRLDTMLHLMKPNLALSVGRAGLVVTGDWDLIFVVKEVCDHNIFYRGSSYNSPLYLYKDDVKGKGSLLYTSEAFPWPITSDGRTLNLNPRFITDLENRIGLKFIPDGRGDLEASFGPEDVFNYIYAVFYSPTYRSRYAQFLKLDFPRVPLTSNPALFRALTHLGGELVALHLLEAPILSDPITRYPLKGDHKIEKGYPKYLAPGDPEPGAGRPLKAGRVYINQTQYFEGVPPDAWAFQVGGYQVCHKWLKDRRGRTLSYDERKHYQQVVKALAETIRLMAEIDAVIEAHGGWPLK